MLTRVGLVLVVVVTGCAPTAGFEVRDAWIRAPLPGKTVAAGYFTLINRSGRSRRLINVSGRQFDRVELHTQTSDGDMMRMRRLDHLSLPDRGRVEFTPGGHHLMLFGPSELSDTIELTFEFDDGTRISTGFEVRGPTMPHG